MTKKTTKTEEKTQNAKLVKMEKPCGKKADVHPDMVDDYKKGGYHKA